MMKGLLLKDFYNLSRNIKFMLGMMVIFSVGLIAIDMEGVSSLIVMWGVLSSMQVVTTFSFDEMTKWTTFAMTLPVTRRELVRSKFLMHLILSVCSVGITFFIGAIASVVQHTFTVTAMQELLVVAVAGLAVAIFTGGLSIPLLLKFGVERARIIAGLVFTVPMCVGIGITTYLPTHILQNMQTIIPIGFLILAFIWEYAMYLISCQIFVKKDLTQ